MAEPTDKAQLAEQTLAGVTAVLDAGAATLGSADWQEHDQLVNSLMDVLSTIYLRTQPSSGYVQGEVIWPDFGARVLNFGCFKSLLVPLVARLDAITRELEQLPASVMAGQDAIDLANLRRRVDLYLAALEQAPLVGPDPIVWERVTMPLLLGYYPSDFVSAGIQDPSVKSPPDVVRPYTLSFQVALAKQARQEAWQALPRDLVAPARAAIDWMLDLPAKIVEGAKAAGRFGGKLLIGLAVGAGIAAVVSSRKSAARKDGR